MKIRAKDHNYTYPYLYDGETQATAKAYGVLATPHVYIFDAERKLRYVGRFDDAEVKAVKSHDAKNAVEALLAGKPVPVATTRVFGCSTKWAEKQADARKSLAKWDAEPVTLEPIDIDAVAKLAKNDTQEAPGREPLGDLVRPVRRRAARAGHDEPDVSRPERSSSSRSAWTTSPSRTRRCEVLKENHVAATNYILNSTDRDKFAEALDQEWPGPVPYTLVDRARRQGPLPQDRRRSTRSSSSGPSWPTSGGRRPESLRRQSIFGVVGPLSTTTRKIGEPLSQIEPS